MSTIALAEVCPALPSPSSIRTWSTPTRCPRGCFEEAPYTMALRAEGVAEPLCTHTFSLGTHSQLELPCNLLVDGISKVQDG